MVEIVPSGAALGAEVRGLDVSKPISAGDLAAIKQAWTDHLVLLFCNQTLSDDDLVRFSEGFGVLEPSPASAMASMGAQEKSRPEIWIISNVVEGGKPIGALGDGEADWHTDMSYVAKPPMASVLYSLEIPRQGGDTSFATMYLALEALPDDLRQAIEGKFCHHDASTTSVGETRIGFETVADVRTAPGVDHPMVAVHPVTGKASLYLGRRRNAYVQGMTLGESEVLLDRLWAHCADPAFAWRHQWQVGDLLIWDNRCANHRRESFDGGERRIMHRTQISGAQIRAA